jgi:ketosteroid isomerase-like protein
MADNDPPNENQIRTLVENWAKAVHEEDMDAVLVSHSKEFLYGR